MTKLKYRKSRTSFHRYFECPVTDVYITRFGRAEALTIHHPTNQQSFRERGLHKLAACREHWDTTINGTWLIGENKKNVSCVTCCEVVARREPHGFQFTVGHKFYPQIAAAGPDVQGTLLAAVASNYWREAKWPIPYFDMVKFTFPRRLYWVLFIKEEINTLSWGSYKEKKMKTSK